VPSGYWPAPIGDGKLAGVVIGSTDYSGIVLDVTTRGTTTSKNLRSKNADLAFAPYKGALMPAF
ncbi:hypothetical protein, partial [Thiolapillus sp.]|uniref:hypothetical protein n=1 Tax=Thiolapillus sp. TaxID=2017437 RepID=UPI003AF8582B